jgi:superfamily II DNA or RNA helicase
MENKMEKKGYIYVRTQEAYELYDACKLGKTDNIRNRESCYITGEIRHGDFSYVFEVPLEKLHNAELWLHYEFRSYRVYFGKGNGTEFYKKTIIPLIKEQLKKHNIEARQLTSEEILTIKRKERIAELLTIYLKKISICDLIKKLKTIKKATCVLIDIVTKPNPQQQYILDIIIKFFEQNNIGKLIWACGLGKALLSILIIKLMNYKSIIIGVPGKNLQAQMKNEILKLFPNRSNILFVGGDENDNIKSTTDKMKIMLFLRNNINDEPKFIITTYHSCNLLVDTNINVDFKIGDEAHHLVGIETEENKGFRSFHKISSKKTLFMTATEKIIETKSNKVVYSMEDKSVFGELLDNKSVHWAIENKKITDYNIIVVKNTENEVDSIITSLGLNNVNKDIFISCYMSLKSFEKYSDLTHILLYANTIEDANLCKKYINDLLILNIVPNLRDNFYNNSLHSGDSKNLENEVCKFKNSTYGIISSVYIFGEGFDLPKLNGVCIVGNMKSEIRIVQSVLRPNRLEFGNPNKVAYVIIPYIDSDDWELEIQSYEKVRTIISNMRNVDETIEQKITLFAGNNKLIPRQKPMPPNVFDTIWTENCDELNKLKLRLRHSKSLTSNFSEEQDEYNYVSAINKSLNIQSKAEYFERKSVHINYIEEPEEYFKKKGVWNNWYDFIGVDTKKFIQSKQDWIKFCKEKNVKSFEDYEKLCTLFDNLPKEPVYYYIDFTNISNELGIVRHGRR